MGNSQTVLHETQIGAPAAIIQTDTVTREARSLVKRQPCVLR